MATRMTPSKPPSDACRLPPLAVLEDVGALDPAPERLADVALLPAVTVSDEIGPVRGRDIGRHGKDVGGDKRTAFLVENEHVLDLRQPSNEVLELIVQPGLVLPDLGVVHVVDEAEHVAYDELRRLEGGAGTDIEKIEGAAQPFLVLPLGVAVRQPARADEQQERHDDGRREKNEGCVRRRRATQRPGLEFQEAPHVRLGISANKRDHEV